MRPLRLPSLSLTITSLYFVIGTGMVICHGLIRGFFRLAGIICNKEIIGKYDNDI